METIDLGGNTTDPDRLDAAPATSLPYITRRLIGRGGSSEVFEALDPVLRRAVALKVLRLPVERPRFLREARIMAQLEHPHIVPVHDFGVSEDGSAWLSMALVEGQTLDQWANSLGEARLRRACLLDVLDVLDRVCDAMAYAHSKGVLHLDLKPNNVMISDYGRVKLMDWGIAKVLSEATPAVSTGGRLYGTPSYVAPEQVNAPNEVDERTDIFGLGGLLYSVLTKQAPHGGETTAATLAAASRGRVQHARELLGDTVPPELVDLTMAALDKDPARRPDSVQSFQHRLREIRRSTWSLPLRRIPAGQWIVRAGEVGREAFVLASGHCEVRRKDGIVVRTLGPGDVFGELAVLTRAPRSMDVIAVDDVTLHVVGQAALASGLGLGTWAGAFARALALRFREVEARGARDDSP